MSNMDKCGKIVWTMGEVTISRCPLAVTAPVSTDGQTSAIQQGLEDSANKRRRKYFDKKDNESDTQTQWEGCKEDQYWTVSIFGAINFWQTFLAKII